MGAEKISKKNMAKMIILIVAVIGVVITTIVFMITATDMEFWEYLFNSLILFFIMMFIVFFAVEKIRNIKQGIPVRDEMQWKMTYKSGFYSTIATLITIAIMGIVNPFTDDLTVNIALAIILLVTGSVFLCAYMFMQRRGAVK